MGQSNSKINNEHRTGKPREKTVIKAHVQIIEKNQEAGQSVIPNRKNQDEGLPNLVQSIQLARQNNAKSQVLQEQEKQNYAFYTSRDEKSKKKMSLTYLSKSHILSYRCWLQESKRQIEDIQESKSQLVSIQVRNIDSIEDLKQIGRKEDNCIQVSVMPITICSKSNVGRKEMKQKKKGKVNLNPIHKQLKRVYAV